MKKKKSSRHSMPEIEQASLPIRSSFAEVLPMPPPREVLDTRLRELIEQKLAEMMGGDAGLFEPFFQPKKIADEIKKLQTVPQQRKWHHYFQEWGCLICEKKNRPHMCLGMCQACYPKIAHRLQNIVRLTEGEEQANAPSFAPDRLTELASGAVRKQLSGETPQPKTRDYITKIERKAQREKAERDGREKRAHRAETLRHAQNLHDYHGWSWKALAEKYDPNFSKDPEAATLRIRIAARECVSPSVRKLGQLSRAHRNHEKGARQAEIWRHARALHVEQNLTWREIAQRLDPDFAKDPQAAIARIMMG